MMQDLAMLKDLLQETKLMWNKRKFIVSLACISLIHSAGLMIQADDGCHYMDMMVGVATNARGV
jgi:hypothetical protein